MKRIISYAISLSVMLLISLLIWGVDGLRLTVTAIMLFWTPVFFILSALPLNDEETVIVSWIFGFGILSSFAYPIGLALGSLTGGVWIAWLILMGVGILLQWKVAPRLQRRQEESAPVVVESVSK